MMIMIITAIVGRLGAMITIIIIVGHRMMANLIIIGMYSVVDTALPRHYRIVIFFRFSFCILIGRCKFAFGFPASLLAVANLE